MRKENWWWENKFKNRKEKEMKIVVDTTETQKFAENEITGVIFSIQNEGNDKIIITIDDEKFRNELGNTYISEQALYETTNEILTMTKKLLSSFNEYENAKYETRFGELS
jgi:hypothetical protein